MATALRREIYLPCFVRVTGNSIKGLKLLAFLCSKSVASVAVSGVKGDDEMMFSLTSHDIPTQVFFEEGIEWVKLPKGAMAFRSKSSGEQAYRAWTVAGSYMIMAEKGKEF